MALFKRATWKSGLTYQQTCEGCNSVVKYMDDSLGFRPWYPDGFVYCPKCQKPLRHNEKYALDPENRVQDKFVLGNANTAASGTGAQQDGEIVFCPKCGAKRTPGGSFCAHCGNKLT